MVQVAIDFTDAFDTLGLNEALLDLRSVRVVPYTGTGPGTPVPYDETYSTLLDDADTPQLGWHGAGVYWTENDGILQADGARVSQGSGSLKATINNETGGYGYPGVELHIAAGDPLTDWRAYESFIYDVWPQVNANALDQAPDLYSFKLYNTTGCPTSTITQGGPPLALDQWNYASVSLKPFHTCTGPSFNNITRLEFHTRDNETVNGNSGLWDDGDQLILWFDHLRLVDQDGGGVIKWTADGSTTKYYVYFDTLAHEGHSLPNLTSLGAATLADSTGSPEAGGYFHQISGASPGGLSIWAAPPVEKIFKTNAPPVATAPLQIKAAKDEFEPFQIVVRAGSTQSLAVAISDFTNGSHTIPASNVTLHRVDYVPISQLSDHFGRVGDWPDPLYPVAPGSNVAFPANTNQPLWFTVHVPRDAAPGLYQATVSIGLATVPVELEVWNFALPQAIHLPGEWGFGWSNVVETYKGTVGGSVQPCYWDLVDALYEDFADHRLVPSIRWELLREGMEDYEYLWLLNGGDPQIGISNEADSLAGQFIASRTRFSRVPTDLETTRAALAARLTGSGAGKTTDRLTVAENGTFNYLLVYRAGDSAHTVTISDEVPLATTVLGATGSKSPDPSVTGQSVTWAVPVASQETVTLTIAAQAVTPGLVTNQATFSGEQLFTENTTLLIYTDQVHLPVIFK